MNLFSSNDTDAGRMQIPWLTGILFAFSLFLFLLCGKVPAALVYDRTALAQGELWCLLTGHFTHCDLSHLLWNILPLALIGSLLEQRIGLQRFAGATLISCLGVSGWLWFARTDMLFYCGLSGMLNGLLIVLLVRMWQENRHPVLPLMGLSAIAKILFETAKQETVFARSSWDVLPEAHGAGLVAGIIFLVLTNSMKGTVNSS